LKFSGAHKPAALLVSRSSQELLQVNILAILAKSNNKNPHVRMNNCDIGSVDQVLPDNRKTLKRSINGYDCNKVER
jgi:hypothetical protein